MKLLHKPYRALLVILALFFVMIPFVPSTVSAQVPSKKSISGDEVCGSGKTIGKDANGNEIIDKCNITYIAVIMKSALKVIIGLGLPLLVVFITYRFVMAWFALQQGNAGAYKDALSKSVNAVLGFFFIVALLGGLFVLVLKFFGIKSTLLGIPIFSMFLDTFVTHAYAKEEYLPNFFISNDIYDLILAGISLVMRFFIYPALLAIWVWTGFSFVAAQGAPDALMKAKKWFMYAVVTTFVIFMVQMFLFAAKGTVEKILPDTGGQAGQACTIQSTGKNGITGTDGVCYPGR